MKAGDESSRTHVRASALSSVDKYSSNSDSDLRLSSSSVNGAPEPGVGEGLRGNPGDWTPKQILNPRLVHLPGEVFPHPAHHKCQIDGFPLTFAYLVVEATG